MLETLTKAVPIEWLDDLTSRPTAERDAITQRCRSLLVELERPSMPKPIARDVRRVIESVLGPLEEPEVVEEALARLFVSQLWRSQGKEAELAADIVHELEQAARIRFDQPKPTS